jgi:hypothetical protein
MREALVGPSEGTVMVLESGLRNGSFLLAAVAACSAGPAADGTPACSFPDAAASVAAPTACERYFQAIVAVDNCGETLPDTELTRLAARIAGICQSVAATPGNRFGDDNMDRCAQALAATPCGVLGFPTSCVCRSLSPDAGVVAGVDDPCMGAGAPLCADGLYCSPSTGRCAVPGALGAPCDGVYACEPGLRCVGTCEIGGCAGDLCSDDRACGPGLVCSPSGCAPFSWVSPGEVCNHAARCVVGHCPNGGTCPRVVADGDPCDPADETATCDTFSRCTNGVCAVHDLPVCK